MMMSSIVDRHAPARWWRPLDSGKVLCELCPRFCRLSPGQRGYCWQRRNLNGELVTDAWETALGIAADPIEKKPLYHVRPGSRVLSFGTHGCNLGCRYCQNSNLSRGRPETVAPLERATAHGLASHARQTGCTGIAFTYNEPLIFGEWMIAVSQAARENGLFTVAVTNGFACIEPAREILTKVDAVNVDLKAFNSRFFRELTHSRMEPVLELLAWIRRETECWLELTTLLIEDWNDSPEDLKRQAEWILTELGEETPLHLSAFHPAYRMMNHQRTSAGTLLQARQIVEAVGLKHVYLGNLPLEEGRDTRCAGCGALQVRRDAFGDTRIFLRNGSCSRCGKPLAGIW